jgi:hypothetical protein
MEHQIVPIRPRDHHVNQTTGHFINPPVNVMAKANLLIVHGEKPPKDLNVKQNQAG